MQIKSCWACLFFCDLNVYSCVAGCRHIPLCLESYKLNYHVTHRNILIIFCFSCRVTSRMLKKFLNIKNCREELVRKAKMVVDEL